MKLNQVLIPISNLQRSFDFYSKLGLEPIVKTDVYARFVVPGNEASLSIQVRENIKPYGTDGIEVAFEVDEVDATVKKLKAKGLEFYIQPVDQKWKWREAYLKDPDGNTIMIFHAGTHRINPINKLKK